MHPKNPYRTLLSDVFLHYTTHRTGNKCHNTKKTPFLKDVSLSCLECLGGDPETRTMMVFRFLLHYTTHRTGNKCHNTKKTPFLKDVSLSCLECLGGDPETRTMMVFRFLMAPSNQIPHQAVTPGRSILKRRITIEDHNRHIRNRTGDQEATLPPTTGGICRCALEANQGN